MSEKKTGSWKELVGARIKKARERVRNEKNGKRRSMTQEQLSEKLGVTFQAVSSWERGEFLPDTERLPGLSRELNLGLNALLADRDPNWELESVNFEPDHMKTYVKGRAKALGLTKTLQVIDLLETAHGGQRRESRYGFGTDYAVHPLTLACHALAMGLNDDDVIAVCIAHDMLEDGRGRVTLEDLPEGRVRDTVKLLSTTECPYLDVDWRDGYYGDILKSPLACLVKCLDRVNNVAGMADWFSRDRMVKYLEETDLYYQALLKVIKKVPEWNDAWWLLRYQLTTTKETLKRVL